MMPLLPSAESTSSDDVLTSIELHPLEEPDRGRTRFKELHHKSVRRSDFRSPISPDRFIPQRQGSPSTPFRVNTHPLQLSPQERFFRQRSPGDDPFLPMPYSPPEDPVRQSILYNRASQRPRYRPHLVTDPTILGTGPNELLRRVSSGTVWGVGGNAASIGGSLPAATNGPQSPASRGSTAPSYVARFLPRRNKADDQKKHESRIALALDIDPAKRLLGTCVPSLKASPSPSSPDYERFAPFVWKGGTWKKVEREHCKQDTS